MGLTTWKNAPQGKILRSDTHVAKNYLNEAEIDRLNRLVTMFIDFAELRALNHKIMLMQEWIAVVDKFLDYTDQQYCLKQVRFRMTWRLLKLVMNMTFSGCAKIGSIFRTLTAFLPNI